MKRYMNRPSPIVYADVAQLVELLPSKQVVACSSHVIRSHGESKGNPQSGDCPSPPCGSSSVGRAPRCQRGGREFESHFPLKSVL